MFRLTDKLVLFPSTDPIATSAEQVLLRTGDATHDFWLYSHQKPNNPKWIIVHTHGNASRAETEAEVFGLMWHEQPIHFYALNLPGYGASTGPASLHNFDEFTQQATHQLMTRYPNAGLILSGNSIGSLALLAAAKTLRPQGIVLQNPPPLKQLIMGQHGWWNLWLGAAAACLGVPADLDSVANAKQLSMPLVMISAEYDTIVPKQYQDLIYDAYAGPKLRVTLPSASHNVQPFPQYANTLAPALIWLFAQMQGRQG